MADVITRFKLETTQYDSKLRDSVQKLKEIIKQAELGGKGFDDFEKSTLDAAKALGSIETSATNSKDKVKELVGSFNTMANTYNTMSKQLRESDVGRALAESMTQLKDRIKDAKQELYGLNSEMSKTAGDVGGGMFGGMFSGKMTMASFKGNVYAMAAEKGAEALSKLKDHIQDILKESMKISQEAEGIQLAFDRLNQPDLLNKLKEATHGTVSELELMKQAVKFNDFRLNLDEMGTLLAFAQQKAKDTGQSVDYMVDSIVTGLGRQSLMILDNLGLSAAEIKEKMKGTGDMTKAVAEIIRDQMSKAGDYIETAADRAAIATADVQNEMKHLGDKMRETFGTGSIEEFSNILEVKLIQDLQDLVGVVGDVATGFGILDTDAGQTLRGILDVLYPVVREVFLWATGLAEVARLIHWIKGEKPENAVAGGAGVGAAVGNYLTQNVLPEVVITPTKRPKGGRGGVATSIEDRIRASYEKATDNALANADSLKHTSPFNFVSPWQQMIANRPEITPTPTAGASTQWSPLEKLDIEIKALADAMEKAVTPEEYDNYRKARDQKQKERDKFTGDSKPLKEMVDWSSQMAGGINSIVSGIEGLGIEIPEGLRSILTGLNSIISIASGISTILIAISMKPFAGGGIVRAAQGFNGVVPGFNYSGDMIPARLNAGEVVLNKAQANSLAGFISAAEQGGGGEAVSRVSGEQIYVILSRYLRRSGRGELATWK